MAVVLAHNNLGTAMFGDDGLLDGRKRKTKRKKTSWITVCVQQASFSNLVNGAAASLLVSSLGLRQGCPLSPFLFVLCSELLPSLLKIAVNRGELHPYQLPASMPSISHLIFIDDRLFTLKATTNNANVLRRIMITYNEQLRQHVNMVKSHVLFSPELKVATQQNNYSGVPISGKHSRVDEFNSLLDKTISKLQVGNGNV
ncbi:uncharacterized protein [Elaeis guineensis]|uniref:uncharacterized protein n=1 Tax=Elaeis guineensis var. tenera TaxID=51953 RepID=UPI003C6D7503